MVSIDVFSAIWREREPGESSEDAVLRRLLGVGGKIPQGSPPIGGDAQRDVAALASGPRRYDVRWVDDVVEALTELGGTAKLAEIYKRVWDVRHAGGRSTPPNLPAVVRKELEMNSSDSEVHDGRRDLFTMPEGKGAGVWALRTGD